MVIVDTGVLYALADRRDAHHAACVRWLVTEPAPMIVPPMVVAEACYLIGRHLGARAEATFLDAFGPAQRLTVGELLPEDTTRMAALVRQYADLGLGGTDAAVIAMAERLGVTRVATVDRRHFTVVRPAHAEALTLLPDPFGSPRREPWMVTPVVTTVPLNRPERVRRSGSAHNGAGPKRQPGPPRDRERAQRRGTAETMPDRLITQRS